MDHDNCKETVNSATEELQPLKAEPGITLPAYAARTALKLAEGAVDEINARLRAAEEDRDELVRKLGRQQEMVDRLLSERDYRTRHVRTLLAARDA